MARCALCNEKDIGGFARILVKKSKRIRICTPCIKSIVKYVIDRVVEDKSLAHYDEES